MAYMSQENKAGKAPVIKAICKRFGVKASLAVRHHSTLVLNISAGKIDFIGNYNALEALRNAGKPDHMRPQASGSLDVNPYWYQEHFSGKALEFLNAVVDAMNVGNHNKSDLQSDYHNVGWYVDVNVGRWNKPYEWTGAKTAAASVTEEARP